MRMPTVRTVARANGRVMPMVPRASGRQVGPRVRMMQTNGSRRVTTAKGSGRRMRMVVGRPIMRTQPRRQKNTTIMKKGHGLRRRKLNGRRSRQPRKSANKEKVANDQKQWKAEHKKKSEASWTAP